MFMRIYVANCMRDALDLNVALHTHSITDIPTQHLIQWTYRNDAALWSLCLASHKQIDMYTYESGSLTSSAFISSISLSCRLSAVFGLHLTLRLPRDFTFLSSMILAYFLLVYLYILHFMLCNLGSPYIAKCIFKGVKANYDISSCIKKLV